MKKTGAQLFIIKYSNQILDTYQNNTLFSILCRSDFTSYLAKQTVKNAKKIFNINQIEGILTAYKLFYVGCSRARKNLIIVVDEKKVSDFKDTFIKKLQKIGFKVKWNIFWEIVKWFNLYRIGKKRTQKLKYCKSRSILSHFWPRNVSGFVRLDLDFQYFTVYPVVRTLRGCHPFC